MSIDPNNLAGTAHLTFDDEFNALSLWNGSSGTWATTFWYQSPNSNGTSLASNGEQEWYLNSQYGPTSAFTPWTVSSGMLTLKATPTPSWIASQVNNYAYISGELNTFHSFSQTYGYFEINAELPKGQGFWPAFWLMPENGNWPPELDAMEVLGSAPTTLVTTVHSNQTGSPSQQSTWTQVPDTSAGFHTYGVDWEPDTVTWYFDGQQVFQTATPSDMNSPMYMILNLAVGGYWPGSADGVSSAQMQVDWVRAFASGAANGNSNGSGNSSNLVSTSAAVYTAPAGVTSITLTGSSPQTVTGNSAGDTIFSDNISGNHLIGGTGADTIYLGRAGDIVTGGGGADTFTMREYAWTGTGQITDFSSQDVLNVTPMLQRYGYAGSNALADGTLSLASDGHGDTQLWINMNNLGGGGSWLLTTIDGVAPSSLQYANGQFTETAASGGGGSTSTGSSVSTSAATYVAPSGVTNITLTGWSAQTVTGNNAGDTFVSSNATANHLTGGTGADTFYLGRGGDIVTGGGGADTFIMNEYAWAAGGQITDFSSQDVIDVASLLQRYGYAGSNALADGTLSLTSNGHGDTQLWLNMNNLGGGGSWLLTTINGVAPSSLQYASGQLTETSASGGGGSTSTGTAVSTSAASYVAPSSVTSITLTGSSAQTVTGNNAGDTFISSNATANHLIGGSGNDTFYLGRGGDIVTGGGGTDTFIMKEFAWASGGQITDFAGSDVLNVSPMLQRYGYAGSNPFVDGTMSFVSDGHGGTQVWLNMDNLGGEGHWLLTTLNGISTANLAWQNGAVVDPPSTGAAGTPTSGSAVSTSAASYVAPSGVSSITLTGSSAQTVTGNNAGDTFISSNATANHLIGGSANDTFYLGRGGDIVTGGGGADTFIMKEFAWAAGGQITDFSNQDVLNVSPMLQHYGYAGSNPINDGTLSLASDGHGDTQVWINMNNLGGSGSWLLTTLEGLAPSSLQYANGNFTEIGAATASSSGASVSTGAATYSAPAGVSTITLTASGPQTATGNSAGDTFVSSNYGNHLVGGVGADTFDIGRGGDLVTGGGGADTFVFNEIPWSRTEITDFAGQDRIDLQGLFAHYQYGAVDPIADGRLTLASDGHGGTQIWFDMDHLANSSGGTWLITTLDGVSPASLHLSNGWMTL